MMCSTHAKYSILIRKWHNDRMAYGHSEIWHMQEKTHNSTNGFLFTIPIVRLLFSSPVFVPHRMHDWQWVSVLSECDRMDASAADCLKHIVYTEMCAAFYNFVSLKLFFICSSVSSAGLKDCRHCTCVYAVRICMDTLFFFKLFFLSLLTILSC